MLPPGRSKDLLAVFVLFPATVFLGASVRLPTWLHRPARVSGDISYPLYVIHLPLIVGATAVWQAAMGGQPTNMPKYVIVFIWLAICSTALWLERAVQPPGRRLVAALIGRSASVGTQRIRTSRQLGPASLQNDPHRTSALARNWAIFGGGAAISLLSLSLAVAYLWPPGKPLANRDEPRCKASAGYSSPAGTRTYLLRPDLLQSSASDSSALGQANSKELIAAANEALSHAPHSVMEKSVTAPSGDKHDYVSLDNYSWQDAKSPTGWTWRDGHFNPAYTGPAFDYGRLWSLVNDAQTLALAYDFTHDRRYSRHLAAIIRTWFLNPATRMNPNQSYAQLIPGTKSETNGNGSIDGWRFVFLIDAVGLVQGSGDLTAGELAGLRNWFSHYLTWMSTSAQGQHELRAKGNHAVYYDIQRIDFALFTGQDALARGFAQDAASRTSQINRRGELPQELAREDKPHYIAFGSNAFAKLASLSACAGVDLWNYKRPFRGDLPHLYASLADYVSGRKPWPSKHAFREPEPAAAALSQSTLR